MPTLNIVYKTPAPFADLVRDQMNAIDWTVTPVVSMELPDGTPIRLEAVKGRRGETVIRAATPGSALKIRNYSDKLAAANPDRYPQPSAEEVARVIQLRNPEETDVNQG